uniref:Uncharacterized protein n=1 Tax=Globodera rostochiensis TaxID=31243 RepID=A0A914H9F2_GLORO
MNDERQDTRLQRERSERTGARERKFTPFTASLLAFGTDSSLDAKDRQLGMDQGWAPTTPKISECLPQQHLVPLICLVENKNRSREKE